MSDKQTCVLLIEDSAPYREMMRRFLEPNYRVLTAETGQEGLERFVTQLPHLVLLDYVLPDVTELELLDELVARQATIVVITGEGNTEIAVEAMRRGAVDYLPKRNVTPESLHQALEDALRAPPKRVARSVDRRFRILVVDDDEANRQAVRQLLGDDYELFDAATVREGWEIYQAVNPDCVLLDFCLPDADGLTLLDRMGTDVPVVMLTGEGNETLAVEAMKRGAQDYLSKKSLTGEALWRAVHRAIGVVHLKRKVREQQVELERRAVQLERSNRELETFAYAASHDLQEPLRSISGFCELLRDRYRGQFDEQADRWMEKVIRGGDRMKTMIGDLLAYSRIDTRGNQFIPVDLASAFEEAVGNLSIPIRQSHAQVTCDKLPSILADPGQMVHLLQNLIGNAIKYRGAETPRVRLAARRENRGWVFSVSDNGIGIEPEHFERIFQMFKRLHRQSEYPGTGIGLAICQRIVQRHAGRIWVESERGAGSVFHFSLPDCEVSADGGIHDVAERETVSLAASI